MNTLTQNRIALIVGQASRLSLILAALSLFLFVTGGTPVLRAAETNSLLNVSLAWDASPDPSVTGYRLYAHTNHISDTNVLVIANVGICTNAAIENLQPGKWYFRATCYNDTAESEFSNEVIVGVPEPPANMRTIHVQYGATITNATDFGIFRIRIQ